MKTFLFVLAFAFSFIVSNAQTGRGKLFVGGDVGFSSSTEQRGTLTDRRETDFSVVPSVGYFVVDNLAIGLGVGYSQRRTELSANDKVINSGFVLAPFVRYFIATAGDKFFFTPQFRVGMRFGNTRTETATTVDARTQTFDVSLSPGFTYFPSDKWALDFRIRGLYFESVNPEGTRNNTTNFGLSVNSLNPTVGINYFF
jgi:opacity protein-like surface antigen